MDELELIGVKGLAYQKRIEGRFNFLVVVLGIHHLMRNRPLAHGKACSAELFEAIRMDVVKADVKYREALKDAGAAHQLSGPERPLAPLFLLT